MLITTLASATLIIGVAASGALGLLIVLFLRQARRIDVLVQDLDRAAREQKDGAADVRRRLEEGAREVQAVYAAVEPLPAALGQMAGLAEQVGTVQVEMAAQTPVLEHVGMRLERMEQQVARIEQQIAEVAQYGSEGVALVRQEWAQLESMIERSERQLASFQTDRDQETERLDELRSAVGALRESVEDRIEEQTARLETLTGPEAQIAHAALGIDLPADAADASDAPEESMLLPKADADDLPAPDDPNAARWIFFVLALLLGLALLAQWLRMD